MGPPTSINQSMLYRLFDYAGLRWAVGGVLGGVAFACHGWLGGEVATDGGDGFGVEGQGGTDGSVQCLAGGTFVHLG